MRLALRFLPVCVLLACAAACTNKATAPCIVCPGIEVPSVGAAAPAPIAVQCCAGTGGPG